MQFKPFAVPREFVFQDPDTGFSYKASSKADLIKHIVSYRVQNRLPAIEKLDLVVENYLCSLMVNRLNCRPRQMEKGWKVLFKKGVAVLKFMMFKNFVSQEVAEARAQICTGCPLNIKPKDKPFYERWAQRAAADVIGDRRTTVHEKLLECDGCGCNLRAKVWTGDNIELYQDEVDRMRAAQPKCWQVNSKKLVILQDEGPQA